MLFTLFVGVEFASQLTIRLGISITFIALLIGTPGAYSLWFDKLQHSERELAELNICQYLFVFGMLNAMVITLILYGTDFYQ